MFNLRCVRLSSVLSVLALWACEAPTETDSSCEGPNPPASCSEVSCVVGDPDQGCESGARCHFEPGETCQEGEEGICVPFSPEDCPDVEEPVCGCDGVTYTSECVALNAGVSVYATGVCEDTDLMMCPGANPATSCLDTGCPSGEECVPSESDECIPSSCDCNISLGAWICTSDCQPTYTCEVTGAACVIGDPDQGCASGERCHFELGALCQEGDEGVCVPSTPEDCPAIEDPVCGCDGVTYSNECSAINLGVSIYAPGACEGAGVMMCPEPNPATTCLDTGCPSGEECLPSDTGECLPSSCTCDLSIGAWICTDDCQPTYACGVSGEACVIGDPEQSCATGERCHFELGALCQEGDEGVCVPFTPEDCPAIEDPVCGCDGVTYSNECIAVNLGASVYASGTCDEAGLTMCPGPNPATTCLDTGCPSGEECLPSDTGECLPSSCTCELSTGAWICTSDCQPSYACGVTGEACVIGDPEQGCAMGERCYVEPGETCLAGDEGICIPWEPEDCPDIAAPVCGCDGVTYTNECSAINLGVSVSSVGPCEECDADADQDGLCDVSDSTCNVDGRAALCEEEPPACTRLAPIPVVRDRCYTGACTSWDECVNLTICDSEPDTDTDGLCDIIDPYCNLSREPLTCADRPPRCPEGTVPFVNNGCFNGRCGTWAQCSL